MTVIGVSMDEELNTVKDYAKQRGMQYPIIIDSTGDQVVNFRVRVRPTTIFINKEGMITAIVQGLSTPEILAKELTKALK